MNRTNTLILYKSLKDSIKIVEEDILAMYSWQELYDLGLKVLAIKKYRDTSYIPVSLMQAKEAIDAWAKYNR